MAENPVSRRERRRQTEQRILVRARELFAALGFERTTIRAVAEAAEVDPALVMQYFGSKQDLFTAAVRAAPEPAFAGKPEQLADFLIDTLRLKLSEPGDERLAMLRSMLTHPPATEYAKHVVDRQSAQIAEALPGDQARLRAALITSIMLGVRIGRDLLELDALTDAPVGEVLRHMRSVFDILSG